MLPEKLAGKFVCRGSGIVQKCRVMGQGVLYRVQSPSTAEMVGCVCVGACL